MYVAVDLITDVPFAADLVNHPCDPGG